MAGIGSLRDRVQVTRYGETKDALGVAVKVVDKTFSIWVNAKDLRGSERVYGAALQGEMDVEFTSRKCDVRHGDTVTHNGYDYRIEGIPIEVYPARMKFYGKRTTRS